MQAVSSPSQDCWLALKRELDSMKTGRGPLPSSRQLKWHSLEIYGFLHFSINTFADREWGYGDEDPSLFLPTDMEAGQILSAAAAGGLKGLILTCKHHDGFCLWPSRYSDHSVKASPWKMGTGDVVLEISTECARQRLQFGIYLSPWDRHHPQYGLPEYVDFYRNQLRELLDSYGPLFEVWFDGANGGDGFYGGANAERRIDKQSYYGWEEIWAMVREYQLEACILSDGGPHVRWVGNEKGEAGETCWGTLNRRDFIPGEDDLNRLDQVDRGDLTGYRLSAISRSVRGGFTTKMKMNW